PDVLRRGAARARRAGRVRRDRPEGGRCRVAPPAARRRALQPPRRDAGRRPRARVWSAAARVLRDEANVSESRRGARMKAHTAMALFVASTASVWPGGRATAQITLGFESVAGSLRRPVGAANAGDGSGRLFVVEQAGRIQIGRASCRERVEMWV